MYFAIVHASLLTLVLLQGCLLTATVGSMIGIKNRDVLRQKWFLEGNGVLAACARRGSCRNLLLGQDDLEIAFKGSYTIGVVWVPGILETLVIVANTRTIHIMHHAVIHLLLDARFPNRRQALIAHYGSLHTPRIKALTQGQVLFNAKTAHVGTGQNFPVCRPWCEAP